MGKIDFKTMLLMILFVGVLNADVFEENEQRNRQRDIFESLSKDPTDNVENLDIPKILPSAPIIADDRCFDIKHIEVSGVTLIKESKIESITSKYLNRCVSLADLKNLTNELNAIYIDKGYITSQVYLSPQNIAEGNLTLQSVEGKVDNIFPIEASIASAFVGQSGDYLNIRDIENAIENINR
ncbi:MAG: hypothetical protein LBH45_07420, partial [Campylobacteraceae bacterium]|nr:hypothetical protein [Campylobacteraceae bacterium]